MHALVGNSPRSPTLCLMEEKQCLNSPLVGELANSLL